MESGPSSLLSTGPIVDIFVGHLGGRRRYSKTILSSGSGSTQSSYGRSDYSFFSERFSSSGSDDEEYYSIPKHSLIPNANSPPNVSATVRRIAISRKIQKHFVRLTCTAPHELEANRFPRQLKAASSLLRIARTTPQNTRLVVNYFLTSQAQWQKGSLSLLLMAEEEASQASTTDLLSTSSISAQLLSLVCDLGYKDLPSTLPQHPASAVGIRFLVRCAYAYGPLQSQEWDALVRYASEVIDSNTPGDVSWIRGVRLLELLLRGGHSGARLIMLAIKWSLSAAGMALAHSPPEQHLMNRTRMASLQLIRSASASFLTDADAISAVPVLSCTRWMVTPKLATTIAGIVTDKTFIDSGQRKYKHDSISSDADFHRFEETALLRCLALAALIPVLAFPAMREEIFATPEVSNHLFETCFDVILGKTDWQSVFEDERLDADIPQLFPHEDAYDILSLYPLQAIINAFTNLFQLQPPGTSSTDQYFAPLEALLWLSRMPSTKSITSALHNTVFPFLHRIIFEVTIPDQDHADYRLVCRSIGDALTCFGNLFEHMDVSQKMRFVTPAMLLAIKDMAVSDTVPRMQSLQACFALQRFQEGEKAVPSMHYTLSV